MEKKNKKHDFHFCSCSIYNKTINIRFGFCGIQNNKGLGKGYQPQSLALADDHYPDIDYILDIKNLTSSNNIIAYYQIPPPPLLLQLIHWRACIYQYFCFVLNSVGGHC